ncbi:helix-turn-helix protein [Haloactinospora alba]|uniref:Helix-turn-helix protein n=1 Tax=Haloactinospora alba TaxID=405555 RepID=A0A543NH35_9ACTN|nr:helix-turn-helix domain-containing protein [Haloactinospora alba]TQN31157.1 helix-turn-helix protein [Haloactinospora alba]
MENLDVKNPDARLWRVSEVAAECGVHISTVYYWVRTGTLTPAPTPSGGAMRFTSDTVAALLFAREDRGGKSGSDA